MNITVGLVSLGCAKNLVDSEITLGFLRKSNFQIVNDPHEADVLIVNTCGFITSAKEESINSIFEMANYKKQGKCRCLIVTGCLSTRYKQQLWQEIPEIDGLLGTGEMHLVPEIISKVLNGERVLEFQADYFDYDDPDLPRFLATGSHSAYLKIAEGCNHQCAFCAIPQIRGPYRSRKFHSIIDEAEQLQDSGVKELIVIAQDATRYGRDLADKESLASLLRELVKKDLPWIRVLYTYPTYFSDEIITLMAKHDNLLSYVDLPLQHGSDTVLRRMQRPGSYVQQLALIKKIRKQVPDVTVRSSFIVGFPGETEAEFQQLLSFIKEARLQHCGIFQFSPEEGTPAYDMDDQVPDQIKQERYDEAMLVQQQISLELQQELVGQELEVLIEGPSDDSDLVLAGRHRGQAPEIDGLVYIGNQLAKRGDLVNVRITQAHPYDLVGEIVEGDGE